MAIHVNRVLNMKQIKVIGFDMDHTLVKYHSDVFENLTFEKAVLKLLELNYPKNITKFKFDFSKAIRGLVVDKENGNILKVSLYNKIKNSYHGTRKLSHKEQRKTYKGSSIDIGDKSYLSVDTNFSIAFTILFSELVKLKDENADLELPSYAEMADDVLHAVDMAHRDGSLKEEVKANLDKYIIKDEAIVEALERFAKYGKKLWIITNSDYSYTKALLDYTINPFLKDHKDWTELFELTVTLACKPRFFTDNLPFLKVDIESGMLENYDEKMKPGIYQGGYAIPLQKDMGLEGSEILYLGDHIYGDIVKLKKTCDWRTALVIEELDKEVSAYKETKSLSVEIDKLMISKIDLESQIDILYAKEHEFNEKIDKSELNKRFDEVIALDKQLAKNIQEYEAHFNSTWGEVMRAGNEPSFYAYQIEKYACIYMNNISDFKDFSPRTYYRPAKRRLAHEI